MSGGSIFRCGDGLRATGIQFDVELTPICDHAFSPLDKHQRYMNLRVNGLFNWRT